MSPSKNAETAPRRVPRTKRVPDKFPSVQEPLTNTVSASAFAPGDGVSHPQFGEGHITAIEGHKLSIRFARHGDKQIIDSYVKRQKK